MTIAMPWGIPWQPPRSKLDVAKSALKLFHVSKGHLAIWATLKPSNWRTGDYLLQCPLLKHRGNHESLIRACMRFSSNVSRGNRLAEVPTCICLANVALFLRTVKMSPFPRFLKRPVFHCDTIFLWKKEEEKQILEIVVGYSEHLWFLPELYKFNCREPLGVESGHFRSVCCCPLWNLLFIPMLQGDPTNPTTYSFSLTSSGFWVRLGLWPGKVSELPLPS